MNIKEFLKQEVLDTLTNIDYHDRNKIKESDIVELNNEIELVAWHEITKSVIFNLYTEIGDHYDTMIGNGENIKFSDLYEILKRLYDVHHESHIFFLEFEQYGVKITKEFLDSYSHYGKMIFDVIGYDWHLKLSDFQ